MSQRKEQRKPSNTQTEGHPGFTPRLPDPRVVQRLVAQEILGLHMAQKLF